MKLPCHLAFACLLMTALSLPTRDKLVPVPLWPDTAPGEKGNLGEEKDVTKPSDGKIDGKPVIRLGNVSKPTLTFYPAPSRKNTGTTVMVCPGGAYHILALDLEGTEVCEWLNSIGVNAALLKYRVPKRDGVEKYTVALQDAQRAMSYLRSHANDLRIDSNRIGVMGFSAGGHLSATLCSTNARAYEPIDKTDTFELKPNFEILIYPAYLTVKEKNDIVAPETAVTTNTPPVFIAMTADDPVRVETALFYTLACKQAKVPVELHIYPKGGHGYGLRRTKDLVTTWPDRLKDWMGNRGLLDRPT
ncbi:MAG TPA: alpha/beta hydrolase, partial [Candidatus Saccharimonadales bacterium]|nr:alpha/beta hydrolase [Candidatus Saccharimonadales bacterium]